MKAIGTVMDSDLVKKKQFWKRDAPESAQPPKPTQRNQPAQCDICKDQGWVYLGNSGEAHRCKCKATEDRLRRQQLLLKIDGLTPRERERRFEQLENIYQDDVLDQVKGLAEQGHGLVTLFGKPGVGKSTLLICAVNLGREQDKLAIYTTMPDLLAYLRSTFGPGSEDSFDKYWDALIRADILALDELDEFNATSWATERFLRLMDERWRRLDDVLTLCATNMRPSALTEKVSSRLRDHRALIFHVEGGDMRVLNGA